MPGRVTRLIGKMNMAFSPKPENLPLSVILPVFNGEKYLREAYESIVAQNYSPLETILVDDGSTDQSAEIAKLFKPPAQYFYQPHKGLSAALNLGLNHARGEYLGFLDADDIWADRKLSKQIAALETDPDLDMVFGHVKSFTTPEFKADKAAPPPGMEEAKPGYCKGAMLIRRSAFLCVGPFSEDLHVGDFVEWYMRALEQNLKTLLLPDVVLFRRLHDANQGIRDRAFQTDYVRIVKASLDRRRRTGDLENAPHFNTREGSPGT
jgi:glycosyltransferase involved in cell wall biosynthesis